jgi:hypothetical protein
LATECAYGQAADRTKIGQHHIGETFQEWSSITHYQERLDAVCLGKHRKEWDKENCKILKEQPFRTFEGKREYSWTFNNGVLWHVNIMPNVAALRIPGGGIGPLDFQEEVGFLRQAYGSPSKVMTVPYHNAYGAQWESSKAYWAMPDGTFITAFENPEFNHHGALLSIEISSKDEQEQTIQQKQPNPYQ